MADDGKGGKNPCEGSLRVAAGSEEYCQVFQEAVLWLLV